MKCSAAVVFTSKRDDIKNKDKIKEIGLPAQAPNKKQSLSEMEKSQ